MRFKKNETVYGLSTMNGVHYIGHHRIDFYGVHDGRAYLAISDITHDLKVYFRPERTWDDHMGNTPCGEYVILPLPDGSRKRAYLY